MENLNASFGSLFPHFNFENVRVKLPRGFKSDDICFSYDSNDNMSILMSKVKALIDNQHEKSILDTGKFSFDHYINEQGKEIVFNLDFKSDDIITYDDPVPQPVTIGINPGLGHEPFPNKGRDPESPPVTIGINPGHEPFPNKGRVVEQIIIAETQEVNPQNDRQVKVSNRLEDESIYKPFSDQRKYRICVKNNLLISIVSDRDIHELACCFYTKCGGMNSKIEGLAHLFEHGAFLGSKLYPKKDGFMEYVSKYDGLTNAFTSEEDIAFFFKLVSDAQNDESGMKAIKMFFSLVQDPLLDREAVLKESVAVDSESVKNEQNDICRLQVVLRDHLLRSGSELHPYLSFVCGNSALLKDVTQAQLDEFKATFLASRHTFVIASNWPLDKTEQAIKDEIANYSEHVSDHEYPPFPIEKFSQRYFKVKSIEKGKRFEISFYVNKKIDDFWNKGKTFIIDYFLQNQAENSLFSYLKKRHFISGMDCGIGGKAADFFFYSIVFDLTDSGLKEIDTILQTVYYFLGLMKNAPESEINDILQFVMQKNEFSFTFKQKDSVSDEVISFAQSLLVFDPEYVCKGPFLLEDTPETIQSYYEIVQCFDPKMAYLVLLTEDASTNLTTDIYNVKYSVKSRPDFFQVRDGFTCSEVFLPVYDKSFHMTVEEAEEKIPRNITVKEQTCPKMYSDDEVVLYFAKNDKFIFPGSYVYLKMLFDSPFSLKQYLESLLFTSLFIHETSEAFWLSRYFSNNFHFSFSVNSLELNFCGYKIKELIDLFFKQLLMFRNNIANYVDQYNTVLEKLKECLHNQMICKPYTQCVEYATLLGGKWSFPPQVLLETLNLIKFMDVVKFSKDFISCKGRYSEILIYGNLDLEEAQTWKQSIVKGLELNKNTIKSCDSAKNQCMRFPPTIELKSLSSNPDEPNNAHMKVFQIGYDDPLMYCLTLVFNQLTSMFFFKELRTEQQLGYVVQTFPVSLSGVIFWCILVQSSKYSPDFLKKRQEDCLAHFKTKLSQLDEKEYSAYVDAKIKLMMAPVESMGVQFGRFSTEISCGRYVFDIRKQYIEFFKIIKDLGVGFLSKTFSSIFSSTVPSQGERCAKNVSKLDVSIYPGNLTVEKGLKDEYKWENVKRFIEAKKREEKFYPPSEEIYKALLDLDDKYKTKLPESSKLVDPVLSSETNIVIGVE